MKELLKKIHAQWLSVKRQAELECEGRALKNIAAKYRVCDMFRGDENLAELCGLLLSPQAVEFGVKRHFPTLAIFRQFKDVDAAQYGVYIDAGEITLHNPDRVLLVGRTSATVICDRNERHEITVRCGASAVVRASKWAVVKVNSENGCRVIKNAADNAILL